MNAVQRLVLEKRHSRLGFEETLLAQHAKALGIEVVQTVEKHVSRGFFKFEPTDLVAGSIQFMQRAVRAYGRTLAEHTPYPECLDHLLYRKVRRLKTLKSAKGLLDRGETHFIKPQGWKLFTGFVATHSDDFRFNGASVQTPVWISEVVKFVSEWRVYVVHGEVLDIKFADHGGDRTVRPSRGAIASAVKRLTTAGAPAGYAIDFGVLATGETALVELNDGFSIGAYDRVSAETYWRVIQARWQQLIGVT